MIPEEIQAYAEAHTDAEDTLLQRLRRDTHLTTINPRMISGPVQGKLLQLLCAMIQAGSVLEIGTFTGYSAICLARGISAEGMVHTVEMNPEFEDMAQQYFNESGLADKIKIYIGDAFEVVPDLDFIYDLAFIDGDKEHYPAFYELVFDRVRSGGYIFADNVLWGGKVLNPGSHPDKETQGIMKFNEMVLKDTRAEKVFLPLRDGLFIIRKK
ncbi:MAG: O-methyltransferase [Bacteroidota bacterium]